MNRSQIIEKLNEVFAEVFDDDTLTVTESTCAKDIEEWDSLAHLTLIATIEDAFSIQFDMSEIAGFKNVGEMADAIERILEK